MRLILLTLIALHILGGFSFAQFTVDKRSLYHVGTSAVISGTCNLMTQGANNPTTRKWVCFTAAVGIGAVKEFGIDSKPDMGDMAFNALGAYFGLQVTEYLFIRAHKDGVELVGRW